MLRSVRDNGAIREQTPGSTRSRGPSQVHLSLVVITAAALVRLPHYDVAWFGHDQIRFLGEARQVLAGNWDVVGPLASGLQLLGPLYSYLLAGLLWIHDDPRVLALFNAGCEIGAAWCLFDVGRRLSGRVAGLVAAATYITAPVLVIGTRMVWNPSPLPGLIALGWWLTVRAVERPSTPRLAAVALAAGATLPLHATGIFHAAAWTLAAVWLCRPAAAQVLAMFVAGALPLLPAVWRLTGGAGDLVALGGRLTPPTHELTTLLGLDGITLGFPRAIGAGGRLAGISAAALHVQALVAACGAGVGILRGPNRVIWFAILGSIAAQLCAALTYAGPLEWYHFVVLVPGACLLVGRAACLVSGPPRLACAAALVGLAAVHGPFIAAFDARAVDTGMIAVRLDRLGLQSPAIEGHAFTMRRLVAIDEALAAAFPDGATALLAAHGARAELWRATGAAGLPAAPPVDGAVAGFVIAGKGAMPLKPGARVVEPNVCVDPSPQAFAWTIEAGTAAGGPAGRRLSMPARPHVPSHTGPITPLSAWPAGELRLLGRFDIEDTSRRRLMAVSIHGDGHAAFRIERLAVNGHRQVPMKTRVIHSSLYRNQEWLIDVTPFVTPGANTLRLDVTGPSLLFDIDVFDVPCLDGDWYY